MPTVTFATGRLGDGGRPARPGCAVGPLALTGAAAVGALAAGAGAVVAVARTGEPTGGPAVQAIAATARSASSAWHRGRAWSIGASFRRGGRAGCIDSSPGLGRSGSLATSPW